MNGPVLAKVTEELKLYVIEVSATQSYILIRSSIFTISNSYFLFPATETKSVNEESVIRKYS